MERGAFSPGGWNDIVPVTGAALVYAGGTTTNDEVVFGEPDDLGLLGARSLEGLNLRVDPVTIQLVDAGPAPAAAAA